MRRAASALVLISCSFFGGALAAPSATIDHVCAADEAKGSVCPATRARSCDASGAFVACTCPPGSIAASPSASCALDAKAKPPALCVVTDATIGDALGAHLELAELAVPTLPSTAYSSAYDVVAKLDTKKLDTLDADDLVALASAHESIEGGAAYDMASAKGSKLGAAVMKRDASVSRAIEARRTFLARFAADPRSAAVRVAMARALLRRAAYGVAGANAEIDRKNAKAQLVAVVKDAPSTTPARDAAFMLCEEAAREKTWGLVLAYASDAAKWAMPKADADDHAYLAASFARIAQARFELADLAGGRDALIDAIDAGAACAPRAECVNAGAAARAVIDRAFAATQGSGRALAIVMKKGVITRYERALPLSRLAELYEKKGAGTGAACKEAAQEALAWASAIR